MRIAITGGAGFIGVNTAANFLSAGHEVFVVDNLSRKGTDLNLRYLKNLGGKFHFKKADVRDAVQLRRLFKGLKKLDAVLHFAGQVAVTTSVTDPRLDFDCNAFGTFNVLEALRCNDMNPVFIYSSTNKVFGGMEKIKIVRHGKRYAYRDHPQGISELQNLDFHSPYGCSKGAADQYVRDYARIYGMNTVVMRQSCIYGYRQFGIEDQGWVAWFTIATLLNKPITIFGDGMQVRDVLFIDDLVNAYKLAIRKIKKVRGKVFNIGGGPKLQMSLLELIDFLQDLSGRDIPLSYADWRPGDQKVYISDIRLAARELGWKPRVSPQQGVRKLYQWARKNKKELEKVFP